MNALRIGDWIGGLPRLRTGRCKQASSYDRSGGNEDCISIAAGETATLLETEGPGSIARLWCTLLTPYVREIYPHVPPIEDPHILRNLILRCYWDGEPNPSVESPLGDFFGVGFGLYRHYTSLLMGMTSGGYFCYFPMPFADGCRIAVTNDSPAKVPLFYYHVTYYDDIEVPETIGRFHAHWRRERTVAGRPYTILEAEGRGHYVGCVLSMQQDPDREDVGYQLPGEPIYVHHGLGFLEGDEQIYVDGDGASGVNSPPPAYHGTGTEDYFNSAWYFTHGEFSAPFHGLTVKDEGNYRISAYRFHVLDPIPFQQSIRADIEHGGVNDTPGCDYSSVAYWYQTEPHRPWSSLPPCEERAPLPPRQPPPPPPPGTRRT